MHIQALLHTLRGCPCGRTHTTALRRVEIGRGIKAQTAEILQACGFPKKILVAAGAHSFSAADGVTDLLQNSGFDLRVHVFDGVHGILPFSPPRPQPTDSPPIRHRSPTTGSSALSPPASRP